MVPAHTSVEYQLTSILIVKVHTGHLVGGEALASPTKSASTATTGESHIICIVCIGHQEHLHIVSHHTSEDTTRIAMLSTGSNV